LNRAISSAFWGYLLPIASARALKLSGLSGFIVFGLAWLLHSLGVIGDGSLSDLIDFIVLPGIPVIAALMAEMPVRDGITHRTLLYPLLGPPDRPTLLLVRTACTMGLQILGSIALLAGLFAIRGGPYASLPRYALAATLGSIGYLGLFGLVHLVARRGLIVCLALFAIFDHNLGRLPFALHSLAPSFHLGVLTDRNDFLDLPIALDVPEGWVPGSAAVLLITGLVTALLSATLFARKNVGEIC
jgi:hypothetical protein